MPLEISEIAVRLAVGGAAPPAASQGANSPAERSGRISAEMLAEIVQTCVDEVLRIIRMSEER